MVDDKPSLWLRGLARDGRIDVVQIGRTRHAVCSTRSPSNRDRNRCSITQVFTRCHRRLGITPKHQPLNYDRVLGFGEVESDPDVIIDTASCLVGVRPRR